MSRKPYKLEQVIGMLHEVEVELSRGQEVGQVCQNLGITEQTYYRWRGEYGGLKVSQARRMKELQRENTRLKRAVADLTLEKLILEEMLEGNNIAPSDADVALSHLSND